MAYTSFKGSKALIDGTWDNPNYWLRYSIVRRALRLHLIDEVGILGPYSRQNVASAFSLFGITKTIDFGRQINLSISLAQDQCLHLWMNLMKY